MRKPVYFLRSFCTVILCLTIFGCATTAPKGFLKLPESNLESRQLQSRQYDTTNTEQIVSAVAGVMQDLGFTLDDSETELGLVVASKACDAKDAGQMTGAFFVDLLCALNGTPSNAMANVDAVQNVKVAVVAKPSLTEGKTVVRITFQRVVWSASNQINRVETLKDPKLYQNFFEKLSKAIFLEAQSI
jgi:hypothetical protein